MNQDNTWLLPEGIDELLPAQARSLEALRRTLLDGYAGWGYQLVITPFIEFLESLLTGTGRDLELQTFKLTDQVSGRQLGVRADITPQAARIDAHRLRHDAPTRLCYIGSVLRTRAEGLSGSRSPLQIGAELYGHAGVDSDVEILCLMMETLRVAGLDDVYLDLGHVGIFRALAAAACLDAQQEAVLFDALQRKAVPEIVAFVDGLDIDQGHRRMLLALVGLNGGEEVLERARAVFTDAPPAVMDAVDYVAAVATRLNQSLPNVPVHFDLAELRAYHYQTGVVFAAFVPGEGQEVARGGRYDHIGEVFGRARPATGFSADLKTLMRLGSYRPQALDGAVLAPADDDPALHERITELRAAGSVVIRELPGQAGEPAQMGCSHRLQKQGGAWDLVPL
ncbi:MAG: ATP phosphoribosyltransferase regulatory subunit [Chromatiaceae bacterium]|nr:ATP phosphoribosyltransferase regulatory subunit [Gammaproteobacteria bacterium]MCP5301114.1 ATP phosphoribosyltransferase regulatory subunit [Chromatiaceae bacterium]MCP5421414.1 ATP phosphoribosyltransferase regulatory subunit [Chromatiaceae bacterium]